VGGSTGRDSCSGTEGEHRARTTIEEEACVATQHRNSTADMGTSTALAGYRRGTGGWLLLMLRFLCGLYRGRQGRSTVASR
jgi:hypothetical protein